MLDRLEARFARNLASDVGSPNFSNYHSTVHLRTAQKRHLQYFSRLPDCVSCVSAIRLRRATCVAVRDKSNSEQCFHTRLIKATTIIRNSKACESTVRICVDLELNWMNFERGAGSAADPVTLWPIYGQVGQKVVGPRLTVPEAVPRPCERPQCRATVFAGQCKGVKVFKMCDFDLHISFFPCGCAAITPSILRKVRWILFREWNVRLSGAVGRIIWLSCMVSFRARLMGWEELICHTRVWHVTWHVPKICSVLFFNSELHQRCM